MRDWSKDELHQLIAEYEERRYLWSKFDPLYKSKEKRIDGYKEIASKFNNCSWLDVKSKIRNMRTMFLECLRRDRKKHGKLQPKWQFYPCLKFLNEDLTDALEIVDENGAEHIYLPIDTTSRTSFNEEISSSSLPNTKTKNDVTSKRMTLERHEMVKKIVNSITEVKEQKHAKFASFIAATMDSMDDPELEKLTEIKIRMLLAEMCQEAAQRQLDKLETESYDE